MRRARAAGWRAMQHGVADHGQGMASRFPHPQRIDEDRAVAEVRRHARRKSAGAVYATPLLMLVVSSDVYKSLHKMKIDTIRIKNFRGYRDEVALEFDPLTVLIGKNDAGKSTVLDMLNIFFNDSKLIDKHDVNKACRAAGDLETVFSVRFSNLPSCIDIDAGNETTLKEEYLAIGDDSFELVKRYSDGGKEKVFIRTRHPCNPECCDLLKKKNSDLKKIADKLSLDCDKSRNATIRHAIWNHYRDDLQIREVELEADPKDGDMKSIWAKIQSYLPVYSLFKPDRSNDDKDHEIQDPLKETVKQIMRSGEIREQLDAISRIVQERLNNVANQTLDKLREMNSEVANTLRPLLPGQLKWEDVFKGISITGDEDIPMSKRGSGVRRLILLNFFRAEVERIQCENAAPNVIYAVEEPETSLHADFQVKLIEAFERLSERSNVQVLLTTHSSNIVKALQFPDLRLIQSNGQTVRIAPVEKVALPFPSLNEVSYLAFDEEASVEYHNELYGYLQSVATQEDDENCRENEFDKWLSKFGLPRDMTWTRRLKGGEIKTVPSTLPTFVRDSIHHPENRLNRAYTPEDLKKSITALRHIVVKYSRSAISLKENNTR